MKILLEQAVEKFGNEALKKAFDKKKESSKKGKGSLNTNQTKQLIRLISCYYESVNIQGKGADRVILCDDERVDILDVHELHNHQSKGNRQNKAKVNYEYEINSLVLNYVLKYCQNNMEPKSLSAWLADIGLVDWRLLKATHNEEIRENHLEKIKQQYNDFTDDDIVLIKDFVGSETSRLKRNLTTVFRKLADKKIILHKKEWYASTTNKGNRPLTNEEYSNIGKKKRKLLNKYGIKATDLKHEANEYVMAFNEEYTDVLKNMGIRYIYEAHGAVVQVSDEDIEEYIDRLIETDELVTCYGLNEMNLAFMVSDFKQLYGKNSLELAKSREDSNKSQKRRIKELREYKKYLPMWEKMLIFYQLIDRIQPELEINPFDDVDGDLEWGYELDA